MPIIFYLILTPSFFSEYADWRLKALKEAETILVDLSGIFYQILAQNKNLVVKMFNADPKKPSEWQDLVRHLTNCVVKTLTNDLSETVSDISFYLLKLMSNHNFLH